MSRKRPRPCTGCGRKRAACWTMPCLHLETVLAAGPRKVIPWLRAGGAPLNEDLIAKEYPELALKRRAS
jgi:hypothetical protein